MEASLLSIATYSTRTNPKSSESLHGLLFYMFYMFFLNILEYFWCIPLHPWSSMSDLLKVQTTQIRYCIYIILYVFIVLVTHWLLLCPWASVQRPLAKRSTKQQHRHMSGAPMRLTMELKLGLCMEPWAVLGESRRRSATLGSSQPNPTKFIQILHHQ